MGREVVTRISTLLAGAGLMALGVVARCASWREVFASGDLQLVPADTHYYIRFALRQLGHFPHFSSFDPYVNFPTGASIYWPPLHTWLVGGMITLFGTHRPELGAAFVDPVLAGVELAVLGLCALRLFGRATAALTMAAYALLPAAAFSGPLGSADHHVHEPFFAALVCLLLGAAFEKQSTRLGLAAGAMLGLSRVFTPLEPLLLVPAALACAGAIVIEPRNDARRVLPRIAGATGLAAAAVLALEVLAFGDPTAFTYEGLTAFQPLFAVMLFAPVAALGYWRSGERRWVVLLGFAVVVALPLLPELVRAASHLGRADPILSEVNESQPMTFALACSFFSAALILGPLAAFGASRHLRRGFTDALPGLVAVLTLLPPALLQIRFVQVLAGPLVILLALGLPTAFAGLRHEAALRRLAYGLGAVAFLAALVPPPSDLSDEEVRLLRPSMLWIREHTPAPSPDPLADSKPAYGIVASPLLGHFLTLWAQRPAVATTFSQAPVHVAGNERAAQVFAATTEEAAYQHMVETGGRYLVLTPWLRPFGHPEVYPHATYAGTLFESAGLTSPGTSHFRLIFDSAEQRLDGSAGSEVRVFEAVPGAVLEGTVAPKATVTATLPLVDGLGHRLLYTRSVRAEPSGHFELRVAFPSVDESDAFVRPPQGVTTYTIAMDGRTGAVTVPVEALRRGEPIRVPAGAAEARVTEAQ